MQPVVMLAADPPHPLLLSHATAVVRLPGANEFHGLVCEAAALSNAPVLAEGGRPMQDWLRALPPVPDWVSPLIGRVIRHALENRVGASPACVVPASMLRLIEVAPARHIDVTSRIDVQPGDPTRVQDVPGLRPGVARRLATLAGRLSRPDGEPIGILLAGPPGTGKTLLARVMAAQSGRAFVQASLLEWHSRGALDAHLRAMRDAFEQARLSAPSVMFLDEADAAGRRGQTGDKNDYYANAVVNCLLECLQGIRGRGDVAVVAASNMPGLIDPAILRAGRIGETVEIGLPDAEGRAGILRHYMRDDFPGASAEALAGRAGECAPAALRHLVLEAVRLAGEAGEAPRVRHLDAAFGRAADRVLRGRDPAALRPAVALGVCAEAYVASLAWGDDLRLGPLSVRPGLADLGRASMRHSSGAWPVATAADLLRGLHVSVAANVARRSAARILSTSGTMPGLAGTVLLEDENAARRCAVMAARVEAALHGARAAGPVGRAGRILAEAEAAVARMLAPVMDDLMEIASLLSERGELPGEDFTRLALGPARDAPHRPS